MAPPLARIVGFVLIPASVAVSGLHGAKRDQSRFGEIFSVRIHAISLLPTSTKEACAALQTTNGRLMPARITEAALPQMGWADCTSYGSPTVMHAREYSIVTCPAIACLLPLWLAIRQHRRITPWWRQMERRS